MERCWQLWIRRFRGRIGFRDAARGLPAIDGEFVDVGGYRSTALAGAFDLVLDIHDPGRPAEEVRRELCAPPGVLCAIESHPVVGDDTIAVAVHADLYVVPRIGTPLSGIALDAGGPPVIELA
jgi:hypothetical protein